MLSICIPIGAFFGVNFIYLVSDLLLKLIIAVFIIYVGISSFSDKKSEFKEIKSSVPKNIVVGSVIGLLSIPLGIGGGSFCVPYLRMLGFDIRRAIGTSAACGITISIASTILFLIKDSVDSLNPNLGIIYWPAVFWISMSSVFFARVGANLSYRINEELLKKIFGTVIILLGILLLLN